MKLTTFINKKLILTTFIMALAFNANLYSWEFKEINYMEMLENHEMFEKYDEETGRFKGTRSEILPIESVIERLENKRQKRENIEREKGKFVENSLIFSMDTDDNMSWDQIAKLDLKLADIDEKIAYYEELLEDGGIPNLDSITNIIKDITKDLDEKIMEETNENTIVLNKLPAYTYGLHAPNINNKENGYGFFLKNNQEKALKNYIKHQYNIGLLFESISNSILYQKGVNKNEK